MNYNAGKCISAGFLIMSLFLYAQETSVLQKAEEAFINGDAERARPLYLNALSMDPKNSTIYYNLGFLYQQSGDHQSAITYYQKGIPYAGPRTGQFYNNLGYAYYELGDYAQAEKMHTAGLAAVPPFYENYLNRANVRIRLEAYDLALDDYRIYLSFVPATGQRTNIERMIGILENYAQDAETRKLAEEARRIEEEERQRQLLESVLNSLSGASGDTRNLSAGTEDVTRTPIDIDIAD